MTALAPDPPADDRTRDLLTGAGFDEAITWSFVSPALAATVGGAGGVRTPLPLSNPLTEDWSVMRTSCLPGVCHALAHNLKQGLDDVWLFEVGRAFWEGARTAPPSGSTPDGADAALPPLPAEPLLLATASHSGDAAGAEAALRHTQATLTAVAQDLGGLTLTFEPAAIPGLRPGRSGEVRHGDAVVGVIGELDDASAEALELRGRVTVAEVRLDALIPERPRVPRFRQPPRHPAVNLDLAVVVAADVRAGDALAAIREAGGRLLDNAELYDEYRGAGVGDGNKSWTFHLAFRAADRTLTSEEAAEVCEAITVALRVRCNATVRS